MNRRTVSVIFGLILAVAVSGATLAAPASGPFAGIWTSTDTDGSSQMLSVSGGGHPFVVYQDFYASGCATYGGPAVHWVGAGQGSVDGDILWVNFRKSGCGTFLQGGYDDYFEYDSGSDTLTDSWGIVWYRSR